MRFPTQADNPGLRRDERNIGADAASGVTHVVIVAAGNVSDVTQACAVLHGGEVAVLGELNTKALKSAQSISVNWLPFTLRESIQAEGAA